MKTVTLGVKLDPVTQRRLKQLGAAKDRSPHWLVKAAVSHYLDNQERALEEKREDDARWSTYVDTHLAYDGDDVEKWLENLAHGRFRPWRK